MTTSKKQTRKGTAGTKLTPITAPAAGPRIPGQDFAGRYELWAAKLTLKDFQKLDIERAADLAVCHEILERHTGCNTPFEDFFDTLITDVMLGRWPNPPRVANLVEEFRLDWESMNRDASLFVETYPAKPEAAGQADAA